MICVLLASNIVITTRTGVVAVLVGVKVGVSAGRAVEVGVSVGTLLGVGVSVGTSGGGASVEVDVAVGTSRGVGVEVGTSPIKKIVTSAELKVRPSWSWVRQRSSYAPGPSGSKLITAVK